MKKKSHVIVNTTMKASAYAFNCIRGLLSNKQKMKVGCDKAPAAIYLSSHHEGKILDWTMNCEQFKHV